MPRTIIFLSLYFFCIDSSARSLLPTDKGEFPQSKVIVWNRVIEFPDFSELLQRSFQVTDGPAVELMPSLDFEQDQVLAALKVGKQLQVAGLAPTEQRNRELIPIPIPVTRGLLGVRVCIIHKKFSELFASIKTLNDLKSNNIEFVVGDNWPDKAILENVGLKTKSSARYRDLIHFVDSSKPRCFSRSINEVDREVARINGLSQVQLIVERRLLLYYPLPTIFYVSPTNPNLAKRLNLGLRKLIESGEYQRIFWKQFRTTFHQYQIKGRILIFIPNPEINKLIPEKVLKDTRLWLVDSIGHSLAQ